MSIFDIKGNTAVANIILNPYQSEVEKDLWSGNGLANNNITEYSMFGGFANGKSFYTMLKTHQILLTYPNVRWFFIKSVSKDFDITVIDQMNSLFGEAGAYTYRRQAKEFVYKNGSNLKFLGLDDKSVDRILSSEIDGATINQAEDLHEEVFMQLVGRLRGTNLPKRLMLIEGNPGPGWCKKRYKDDSHADYLKFYEASSYVNQKNLPDNYIDKMKDIYGSEKIQRYIEGSWDSSSTLVFPGFEEFHHVTPSTEIPRTSFTVVGFDHGIVNPSAYVWISKLTNGEIHVWDEWHKPRATFEELIYAAHKNGRHPIIADYSIKRADRDHISLWEDLLKNGLNLKESNKDKQGNIRLINRLLQEKKLFIHNKCHNLIREMKVYHWKLTRYGDIHQYKEEVVKKDDHALDALMYGIRAIADKEVKEPVVRKTLNQRMVEHESNKRNTQLG